VLKGLGDFLGEEFAKLEDVRKWWQDNQAKSITTILGEANQRKGDKYREEKAKAEKRRREAAAERIRCLETILKYDKTEAIKQFRAELKKPDAYPEVLEFAIRNLGEMKEEKAFDEIKAQLNSRHAGCRIAALRALAVLKNESALTEIAKKLSAQRPDERRAAVDAIAVFKGDKTAATELIAALGKETDDSVRKRIIKKLGEVERPEALLPLVEAVAQITPEGKFGSVRQGTGHDYLAAVGDSIGSILKAVGGAPHKDLAVEYLLAILAVNDNNVKYISITNLGKARAAKAIGVLVDILNNKEADKGLRSHAAIALGEMPAPPKTALDVLFANFKGNIKEVSEGCKSALRNIAGLNGSGHVLNLDLLTELSAKLVSEGLHELVCMLLGGLPEEKDLKTDDKESRDKLYKLKAVLAGAHMHKKEYNAAIALLEKVVAHFDKEPGYREMLGDSYAGFNQVTKAIDEYQRAISIVEPADAVKYWEKNLDLIGKVQDSKEKAKRIDAALKLKPPESIKTKLEDMRQKLAGEAQKEPKTP
jgi:HEAT repeat protein